MSNKTHKGKAAVMNSRVITMKNNSNSKSENLIRAGIVQYDLLERHIASEALVLR